MDMEVSDEELAGRRAAWAEPPLAATSGALYKYIKCVGTAAQGCITDL